MLSMAKSRTLAVLGSSLILTAGFILLAQNYILVWRFDHAFDTPPSFDAYQPAKIAKVSVLYGDSNEFYRGAIQSHQRHAKRHGYPFYILRNPVAEGYWNKAEYLHSILVQELGKHENDRMKWLMWVDADSAIINPQLQLEIFLPPDKFPDIHILASKDQNGLNTGIFFIRVHPWSVSMLTKTLGYPIFNPDIDLGFSYDQTAMGLIFNETKNQPHVLYQPRKWYNTYQFPYGYEGSPGYLLVHFPGLGDRWNHMASWLQTLSNPQSAAKWEMPFEATHYPSEIEAFWDSLRLNVELIEYAKNKMKERFEDSALSAAIQDLEFATTFETDQPELMMYARRQVLDALGS
ncbi:hypothetical protein DV736_g2134, partial [Chaetothyriales sp. CBS 134916]